MEPSFQLADLWEALVDAGPEAECLVAGATRHTRRSLDEAANRVGHALLARGIRPGDRVGIYARNRAEYVESLLGCWKIAACPINVNWRYVEGELRYLIDDADLAAVIVEEEYLPLIGELVADFPRLQTRLVLGSGAGAALGAASPYSYADALAEASPTREFGVPRSSDDVYVLYTGGTTGMPKGVMWRHEDFFYACVMGGNPMHPIQAPHEIASHAVPAFPLDAVVLGQLMHGGGQWLTLISLYSGNRAIVSTDRSFASESVLDLIDRERPATIGLIGDAMGRPLAEAAAAHPGRWDLSSLVSVGNGGAMLTSSVKEQIRNAFPNVAIADSYGASETGAAGRDIDDGVARRGPAFVSDGDTAVLDATTLEPLAPGSAETGLFARRGHIPLGYWNDPAKTASTFRVDSHGVRWVLPGDHALLDEQSRIVLLGRGSGCINSGGEKIFPEEVEAAVRAHPDVLDAVVVGVPHERFGEQVVALVSLREDVDELTLDALQAHCRTKLAGYKIPRALLIGDAPRTNVGKPDYERAGRVARERLGLAQNAHEK